MSLAAHGFMISSRGMRAVSVVPCKILARCATLMMLLSTYACVVDWSLRTPDSGTSAEMSERSPDQRSNEALDAEHAEASEGELDASELDASELGASEFDASEFDASELAHEDADQAQADAQEPAPRAAAVASVDARCAIALEAACTGRNTTQKLVCLGAKWSFDGSCDGRTRCDARFGITQGTCQPIASLCLDKRPGEPVCDGSALLRCGPDLLDATPEPCGEHAHCQPGQPAACVCDSGYARNGDGLCVDIVDCPSGACTPGGVCVEGLNKYECSCTTAGYTADAAKTACVNINDCPANACANGSCVDLIGGYECSCPTGYRQDDTKHACITVCTPGACNEYPCVDTPAGYYCDCQSPVCYWDSTARGCFCVDPCGGGCGF
jgi:hypothetical protein